MLLRLMLTQQDAVTIDAVTIDAITFNLSIDLNSQIVTSLADPAHSPSIGRF